MAINLTTLISRALTTVFNLGSDIVKSATYYRLPTFNPQTGQVISAEQSVSVSAVMGSFAGQTIAGFTLSPTEVIIIRASELTSISSPAKGDYIIPAFDLVRRDIVEPPELDLTSQMYKFKTIRTLDEDWGDLTTFSSSADFGDLTADTSAEDWGALF